MCPEWTGWKLAEREGYSTPIRETNEFNGLPSAALTVM
jgi:hypothetical protein